MSVIKATGLSKKYRLGVIARKMLVDQIESYVARKLGRPDPHARIHEKNTDRMPSAYDFWALKDVSFEVKKRRHHWSDGAEWIGQVHFAQVALSDHSSY